MEKVIFNHVYQKVGEFYNGTEKPLLLFVSYGIKEGNGEKMFFVEIRGIKNPLPFKKAYGISQLYLDSWLENNGWKLVFHTIV